jgi:hypothetical protein
MANTPTLELTFQMKLLALIGARFRYVGDKNTPVSLTTTGVIFEDTFILAENFGNATLWSSGNGNITAFSYMVVVSDQDVVVEVARTTPNPDERALFFVKANCPLVIPGQSFGAYASNTSRLDGTVLVSATDYDNILEIRAQRNVAAGGGAANVRLTLIG